MLLPLFFSLEIKLEKKNGMNGNGEEEEQEAKRLGLESGGRSKMN